MLGAGNRRFWIPKVVKSEAKITPNEGLKRRKSELENEQFPESAKIGEMGAVSTIDNRSSIGPGSVPGAFLILRSPGAATSRAVQSFKTQNEPKHRALNQISQRRWA